MITAAASESHYLASLAPTWRALDPSLRGEFMIPDHLWPEALARQITPAAWHQAQGAGLVASERDLRLIGIPSILCEHGSGQSYAGDPASARHPSYAGGQRDNVIGFLCPNELVARRNRATHPLIPSIVVGSVRHDDLTAIPTTGEDAVAVAFHWGADAGCPESGSAFYAWRDHLDLLTERGPVLGTGHPRAFQELAHWYDHHGIEPVEYFEQIVARARLLVADNTSIMYDWAALDRPVIALNAPGWRKNIHHGLRFWEAIPGRDIDQPADLPDALDRADDRHSRRLRARAARAAWGAPLTGGATRAAEAVSSLVGAHAH